MVFLNLKDLDMDMVAITLITFLTWKSRACKQVDIY